MMVLPGLLAFVLFILFDWNKIRWHRSALNVLFAVGSLLLIGSTVLCIGCYLLSALSGNVLLGLIGCAACGFSVGIFWPGTFSIAPGVLPGGGTAMYALMALAGDLGCSGGPTLVGMAANAAGGELRTGLLLAIVFPVLMLILTAALREKKAN